MRIDNDDLKALYQEYAASRKSSDRKECPSPEALVESFDRSASRSRKMKIVDHISECPFCREEFMALVEFERADVNSSSVDHVARKPIFPALKSEEQGTGRHMAWQYACFLFGFGLVISSFFLLVHRNRVTDIERTNEMAISLLYPGADQSMSEPFAFRWQECPIAEYYILELFDEALLPIWTSDRILDCEVAIPPGVYSRLEPARPYYWTVTAYTQESSVKESPLAKFTVPR
jgi:hypothetical protein